MRRKAIYGNRGFQKITDHFYSELLSRNPVTATWLGEHQFDSLLPEVGAEAIEKEISFLRKMKDSYSSLPESDLSIDERIDREIAINFASIHLFLNEDLQRWKLGKDLAMHIGDSIFLLFVRDFAPLHQRVEAMISRLESVPMFLASGKTLFQKVPALWGEIYLDSARNLPALLDTIETSISNQVPGFLLNNFSKACITAKKALVDFTNWFKNAIMPKAEHDWAMGEGAFQTLMQLRNLGLSTSEMLDIGKTSLRKSSDRIDLLSRKILGTSSSCDKRSVNEVHNRIKANCPQTFEQALEAYKDSVRRSKAFVELNQFATLPENEDLEIMETPDFMAHVIPFAAYMGPEKSAKFQKGTYLVTRNKNKIELGRFNYSDISNTSIHEGYPGHHLQLTGQNLHPSKLRIFSESTELIEGWAHYCEEAIMERGFESTNENYFIQANDEVFRAARILIDINLHGKKWSFDKALSFLMEQTNMDKPSAIAEMKRYTQTPGYQVSYLTGKHLIKEMKEKLKNRFKSDLNDRDFHDLLIYEGSLPIFLGKKYYPEILLERFKEESKI